MQQNNASHVTKSSQLTWNESWWFMAFFCREHFNRNDMGWHLHITQGMCIPYPIKIIGGRWWYFDYGSILLSILKLLLTFISWYAKLNSIYGFIAWASQSQLPDNIFPHVTSTCSKKSSSLTIREEDDRNFDNCD